MQAVFCSLEHERLCCFLPILDKEERGSCPLSIVYCRLSAKHPSRGPGLLKSKNGQRYSHKSTLSIIVIINNSFL